MSLIDGDRRAQAAAADAEGGGDHAIDADEEAAEFVVEDGFGCLIAGRYFDDVAAGDGAVVGVQKPVEMLKSQVEAMKVFTQGGTLATGRADREPADEMQPARRKRKGDDIDDGVFESRLKTQPGRGVEDFEIDVAIVEPAGELVEERKHRERWIERHEVMG